MIWKVLASPQRMNSTETNGEEKSRGNQLNHDLPGKWLLNKVHVFANKLSLSPF